jgi:hypothetical protein
VVDNNKIYVPAVVKYICTNIITILMNYSNFCLSVVTHHH